MSKLLKYKNYFGSIEVSTDDMVLFGRIECINDVVTYEADTVPALQAAFEEAVDDYLETCQALGRPADKPMSGTFNVRVGEDLHKKAYLQARSAGMNLNEFVKEAVREKVESKKEYHFHFDRKPDERSMAITFGSHLKTGSQWNVSALKRRWSGHHDA
ncbi:type II toxin-antitoxin system HicB family antitoxin [Pantoea sp. PSNIH4]|nr:type II toxin-antitoxin system HicB family antitoxin [Pantoea sp. PSNIH5]POU62329.1 type II toxin-antitoxin system HicB family antitoxin [Pantoea sp. PSNIH4]POY66294.1 type II toxin-antitoxin system HicB family antitoxin [Pantoea sp. PSNIH3]